MVIRMQSVKPWEDLRRAWEGLSSKVLQRVGERLDFEAINWRRIEEFLVPIGRVKKGSRF
jgi:hypothetical protein